MGIVYNDCGEIMGYVASYDDLCFTASIPDEEYYETWGDRLGAPLGSSESTVTGVINGIYSYNGINFDVSMVNLLEIKDNETVFTTSNQGAARQIHGRADHRGGRGPVGRLLPQR